MDIVTTIKESGLICPTTLTISITTNCNLRCEHCWVECEGLQSRGHHAPTESIKRLISEFLAIGGETICLTGGEPLTHPDFLETLSFCQSLDLRQIQVQTNATLLTKEICQSLAPLNPQKLSFQVSLDGCSAETHDRVRGPGSFKAALAGIGQLVAHGYGERTTIGFTEMQHNLQEIPALLGFAATTGVAAVIGWSLVQHGKARYTEHVAPPLPGQYIQLLERYHADPGFRTLYDRYAKFAAIEWFKGRDQPSKHICRFIEKPYVSASGVLSPCTLLQEDAYAAFDLHSRSLTDAIDEKLADWVRLRAKTIARSKELECLKGCLGAQHCAGGCFARAAIVAGSQRSAEDRCLLRRAVYEWRPPH